jgi:anti-sigma B factor antagonist
VAGKEPATVLSPDIWGRAGPWDATILDLQVTEHGPYARVVTIGGEIDTLTAPELAGLVTAQLAAAPLVVLNLDGVQFLVSAGLSVLVQANDLATQEGRHLRLVCHSGMVNRALDVAGLREHFSFADTVSAALN